MMYLNIFFEKPPKGFAKGVSVKVLREIIIRVEKLLPLVR